MESHLVCYLAVTRAQRRAATKAHLKVELKAVLKAEKTVPLKVGPKECCLAALMEQCLVVPKACQMAEQKVDKTAEQKGQQKAGPTVSSKADCWAARSVA